MNEAIDWFRNLHNGKMSFEAAKRELKINSRGGSVGAMLTYRYNAKNRDKLPVWDVYPLIIMLERTSNGWYGLNLHYLPEEVRTTILDQVNSKNNNLVKIAKMLTDNPQTAGCYKRYLARQVIGSVLYVPREKWSLAARLPYQKFIER